MILNWKSKLLVISISQFFYRAGSRAIIPILPLIIKEIAKTNVSDTVYWSGWILSSPFIISFFTTPFWGSIGDRIGRNYTTFLAAFGFVLSQLGLSFSSTVALIFISFSFQEIFGGAYPSAISLTASFSPKEKSADSLSYLQFANALGNILGPLFGGLIADLFGYKYVFLTFSILVLIFSFPILFIKDDEKNYQRQKKSSLSKNFIQFINNKILIITGLILLSYTLSVTIIRPSFTLFISKQFAETKNLATISGLLFTMFGISSAVSNLLLPWIKKYISLKLILNSAFLIGGLIFVLIIFMKNLFSFGISLLIIGFCLGVILPIVYSIMSDNIEKELKAGLMGVGSSFQMIGNLLGPILSGFIVASFGLDFSFISAGLILFLGFLFFKFSSVQSEKSN